MSTKLEVITGNEDITGLSAPLISLVNFYKAFNSREYLAAAENWSQREAIGMSNPMGGIRRSWDEIAAGYKRIMSGTAKVYVEYYDFTFYQDSKLFYVYGRERGHFSHADLEPVEFINSRLVSGNRYIIMVQLKIRNC